MENLTAKFVKSLFWVGGARFLGQACSWLITIFLVRLLTPEDFGMFAMVLAYQAVAIILYDLCLGQALVQRDNVTKTTHHTVFWFVLGLGMLSYIVTFLVAPHVASFFHANDLIKMLRLSALATVFQSVQQVPYSLMSKHLDFEKRSKAEFMSNAISLLLTLILALRGYGLWSLIFGYVSKHFFQALFICYLFEWSKFFSLECLFSFSFKELSSLLKFSTPFTGSLLLRYIFTKSDTVIIGRQLGATSLGYYSVAADLARIPVDKFVTIINQVCFPVFSQLQNDLSNIRYYFFKTLRLVSLVVFPISIGAVLLSNEIIILVLTSKWQPILYPFICLCFVAIMQSLAGIVSTLLNSLGHSTINFKFSLIGAIVLPPSFYFTARYDFLGIALSWLIIYPFLFVYLILRARDLLEVSLTDFLVAVKTPASAVTFMAFIVFIAKTTVGWDKVSLFLFIGYVAVGVVSYVSYILISSPETISDLKTIYASLTLKRTSTSSLRVEPESME